MNSLKNNATTTSNKQLSNYFPNWTAHGTVKKIILLPNWTSSNLAVLGIFYHYNQLFTNLTVRSPNTLYKYGSHVNLLTIRFIFVLHNNEIPRK